MFEKKQKRPALSLSKGFTIIELIVVIAIIGVLASVVLVSVGGYIAKAKRASALSELSQIKLLGTDFYSAHSGSYSEFCLNPKITQIRDAIGRTYPNSNFVCNDIDSQCGQTYCSAVGTACLNGQYVVWAQLDGYRAICISTDASNKQNDFSGPLDDTNIDINYCRCVTPITID